MPTIGNRIKEVRGKRSREKMASEMGVSKNTIVNYETGVRSPSADFIQMLINKNPGCSADWLFSGGGSPQIQGDKLSVSEELEDYLDIDESVYDEISTIIKNISEQKRILLPTYKLMIIIKLLIRFYSKNFITSERFRKETMIKNIENIIRISID